MCTFIKHNYVIWIVLMTFVTIIKEGNPFSFNEKARQVFSPPSTTNGHSYFGYSLRLRWGKIHKPLIIVGAPRETIRNTNYSEIEEPGSIYMCEISFDVNESLCSEKLLETGGNTKHHSATNEIFNYHDRKDNMWLGMTVGGSHSNGGILMMCAPRWINQIENNGSTFYMPGMCYSLPHTKAKPADKEEISKLTPLVNSSNVLLDDKMQVRAYGQAGMSLKLSKNGDELILGAPGTSNGIGSVVRFSIKKENMKSEKNAFNKTDIYTPVLQIASYFGYSVDSGNFFAKRSISYVAGAPRAADYKGKVLIFDSMRPNNVVQLLGHQVGEYFGSTLAAIDINRDNFTDLIVGAPSYTNSLSYDQGRVYVYMNKKGKMVEQEVFTSLSGDSKTGARFGSSISAIGDINNDGFVDFAIGAPYENDGMGAVYIYVGAENGLNPKYTQKIVMKDMRGFGISISSGVDVDNNTCQDLAIGAYESGKVVLLRSHPSVEVTSTIKAIPSELSLNSTNFIAKICHNFTGATKFKTELMVNILVDLKYQNAWLANSKEATYIAASNGKSFCKEIIININPEKNDMTRPIDIGMNFDLKNTPMSDAQFCKDCVVLTPTTQRDFPSFLRVPFAKECVDHICRPDLSLKVKLLERTPYVIGSSIVIVLNVSVINVGEPASKPQVKLILPATTPLYRVPSRCLLQQSLLSCDVEKLEKDQQTFLLIELDASKLTSSHSVITFNISVSSKGEEATPEDNTQTLEIPLKTVANISIREATSDKQVSFNPDVQLFNISHTYEIRNEGPTSLDIFQMKYYIPIAFQDEKTHITYDIVHVFRPEDDSFSCSVQNGHFFLEDSTGNFNDFDYSSVDTESHTTEASLSTTNGTDLPKEIKSKSDDGLDIDKEDYLPYLMANLPIQTIQPYFSCVNTMYVTCLVVNCMKTGGLSAGGNGALTVLTMQIITSNITKSEIPMILTTYAVALQPRRVFASTHSLIGALPTPASTVIPIWILIGAITVSLLSLALLSFILYKCNFFKRKPVPEELLEDSDSVQELVDGNTYNRSTVVDSVVEDHHDYSEVIHSSKEDMPPLNGETNKPNPKSSPIKDDIQ